MLSCGCYQSPTYFRTGTDTNIREWNVLMMKWLMNEFLWKRTALSDPGNEWAQHDLDFASDVNMKSDPLSLFRVIETTGLVLLWSRGRLLEPGPQCVSSRRYRNTRLIAVGNLKADWAGECRSVAGGEVQEEITHRCARGPVRSVLLGKYRVIIYKRHFTVLVFQGLNPQRSAVCYCGRLVQYPPDPLIEYW